MSANVLTPAVGSSGPWGRVELKTQNNRGWSHSCIGQLPFLFSLSTSKCGSICRAQTCAQSGVERQRGPRRFYRVGQKVRKKFQIFHHFETLRPYISETIKIEAYKQRTQKSFISPLSNCRMCMDQTLTGFYRASQKVRDVIPLLRITPIATQPSAVSASLASTSAVAYVGHRPAHILA